EDLEIPADPPGRLVDIVDRAAGGGAGVVDQNVDVRERRGNTPRAAPSERSTASVRTLTPVALPSAAPSFSRRSPERATRFTCTPSAARHSATASPIPFELPVTSAVRPESFRSTLVP